MGLPSGYKPTKFLYKIKKNETKDLLDTRQDYPYDWYLGGVDSCTGDSGGPLWRNINKEGPEWSTAVVRDPEVADNSSLTPQRHKSLRHNQTIKP